jgi:putative PIN family toxin of toxin-antitoxin system
VTPRAVYDAMVFFQWAALPADRQHGTVKALYDGRIRLCLSPRLIEEVRDLLSRPNIRAKSLNLTDDRIATVLAAAGQHADWFQIVPQVFSLTSHPHDDHLFNLAIESKASFLVTWETRILRLQEDQTEAGKRLQELAPSLRILSPNMLAQELKLR